MGSGDFSKLLVANTASNSLTYIDLTQDYKSIELKYSDMISPNIKNKVNEKIFNIGTHQIFNSSIANVIYTVNSFSNSIFKIDVSSKKILDIVYVGCSPNHMEIYKENIYVTNGDSNSISIIDEENFNLIKNIPVGGKPHDLKIDRLRDKIYIANSNGYSITILDLLNNTDERILMDIHPLHFYMLDENMFILSCHCDELNKSSISLFNLDNKKVFRRIYIDDSILDMTVLLDKNIIYTTNAGNGCLYKIDYEKQKIIDKIDIGGMPNNILWDKDNLLYISDIVKNAVILFDINKDKVVREILVGREPNGLLFI
ncbi:YncE family protein [Clostridium sp. D2Q-14]|uniref:YncE family protein n=1 Tax=Anaeromonas gelatinilytica TaxID=2683194 RepID=UPI00193BE557|nr:YncE family protein [Anaeromonas gelatinilytica]MBS4535938.1 YncE family protein [Anaeromonas gelatinilytica]